jgi:hypothetical protein
MPTSWRMTNTLLGDYCLLVDHELQQPLDAFQEDEQAPVLEHAAHLLLVGVVVLLGRVVQRVHDLHHEAAVTGAYFTKLSTGIITATAS